MASAAADSAPPSQRAVGFVNYDARTGRDARRPCMIYVQETDHGFGQPAAHIVLHGIAHPLILNLCHVPPHVAQKYIHQVHISSTAEYVAFVVSDPMNRDAVTNQPLLFVRVGSELRPCDDYIHPTDDLQGDKLQSLYFPQFSNVGDNGTTWVIATCRGAGGASAARTSYLIRLQRPGTGSFLSAFSFFSKRTRKLAGALQRPVPGTDLMLVAQDRTAPTHSGHMRHFCVYSLLPSANFEKVFEVSLPLAQASGAVLNGFVFYEGSVLDDIRALRDSSAGGGSGSGGSSSSSSDANSKRINCVVVALALYDEAVNPAHCGDDPDVAPTVLRTVVRLLVFRPRGTLGGEDWYVDLYFTKRNIAVFQLSALGQIVVLCPGHKGYFVDVKFFAQDRGPSVSFVLPLDSAKYLQSRRSSSGPPAIGSTQASPVPTFYADPNHGADSANSSIASEASSVRTAASAAVAAAAAAAPAAPAASAAAAAAPAVVAALPGDSVDAGSVALGTPQRRADGQRPPFEEGCFLGSLLPDCFLRQNCVPSRLPPVEVLCDQGRFVIFFSTHVSALLYLDSRRPVWSAVQRALLRDRQSHHRREAGRQAATAAHSPQLHRPATTHTPVNSGSTTAARATTTTTAAATVRDKSYDHHNHDGESCARGMLAIMDRIAISLVTRSHSPSHIDRTISALVDDTATAFQTLIRVFQDGATQMRDPISICMEWIIAAAYYRLGSRLNPPPRLLFNFSAYEGLIHPLGALPRTTAHIAGRAHHLRTSLLTGGVDGGGASSASQQLVFMSQRDEFVKAVERRIDESLPCRDNLIAGFRQFGAYEEELLDQLYPAVLDTVRKFVSPMTAAQRASRGNSTTSRYPQLVPSPVLPTLANAAANGSVSSNNNSSSSNNTGAAVCPNLRAVNELSFLLCRLTALEILGVRLDDRPPIFSTSVLYVACSQDVLPFGAIARAVWLRTIASQLGQFSIVVSPLTRLASKENARLNLHTSDVGQRRRFVPMVNPSESVLKPLEESRMDESMFGCVYYGSGEQSVAFPARSFIANLRANRGRR